MGIGRMIILAAGLATAGCATDTGLGNAVRQNMAAQVIDPDPQHSGTPVEAGSGDRAALAMWRYRKGRVLDPKPGGAARPFEVGQTGAGGGAAPPAGPR